MKCLLTSAGITNNSLHNALVDLLDKPIAESHALCIPTAIYAHPDGAADATLAWQFIAGHQPICPMCEFGWKSLSVLELIALPTLGKERWVPMVQAIDVLLVNGGDTLYLAYWIR